MGLHSYMTHFFLDGLFVFLTAVAYADGHIVDLPSRTLKPGASAEYLWLRGHTSQCQSAAPLQYHVRSAAAATQICDTWPSCEFFLYSRGERSARLCRGT